ncbi:uncharacterized protein si:ch211-127m7.2 [Mugil cephalus]|uniref:uncharacterized protein si:ch211-127m7.2 n=1 Tax=Mugil cephalus TaxID=48193 RepID=UPI001FB5DFA6|nr:uncharacterized protein si:ch211-127m7.2 [Mugil cephalus]
MSERHRALPSWMAKKEEKAKGKEPLKSRRKQKAARSAFYCMNEKELVEAALSYLTSGASEDVVLLTHQQVKEKTTEEKKREKPATSQETVKPRIETLVEESSDCGGDDMEATYVSETDLDITELETLPYTKNLQDPASEGQRSGAVQDRGRLMNSDAQAEKVKEPAEAGEKEDDDDSLRLVREIFFT